MIKAETNPQGKQGNEARNYSNPEPFNTSQIGRSITVTLTNGRIEAGILKSLGAYMISIKMPNGRELIINKGHIITVSIL
ncbi:hypothetical protein [Cuniculiplasma divulgatum]|uniref:Uncharacterized protein n=1 Tax=Cuniculiplasma divulgatum TaxID=1673428 RepID=A0A1N5TMZ3_9ARCH|nr:hypothetical protein [Cuniculiplasma divulgatum]SIM49425.1 hypothetical protein CSP5_0619 [Cuniculiplasma divulgatum]